jgi:hypothetical protein
MCDDVIYGRTPHHVKMKGLSLVAAIGTGWKKVGIDNSLAKMLKIVKIIFINITRMKIKKQYLHDKFTSAIM